MKTAVVLATDSNYLKPAAACLRSIAKSNPDQRVVVIGYELNAKQKLWLKRVNPQLEVEIRDVGEDLSGLPSRWLSVAAYARLLIGDLCDDLDRALYLDSDLLVRESLKPLFELDLEGKAVGAAQDLVLLNFRTRQSLQQTRPKLADFYDSPSDAQSTYFNSGVLLIDVPAWNALEVKQRALNLLRQDDPLHPRVFFLDQDALNIVLRDDWKLLDPTWNLPPSCFFEQPMFTTEFLNERTVLPDWDRLQEGARITHWMGDKPWTSGYPEGPDLDFWRQHFGVEPGLEIPGINAQITLEAE